MRSQLGSHLRFSGRAGEKDGGILGYYYTYYRYYSIPLAIVEIRVITEIPVIFEITISLTPLHHVHSQVIIDIRARLRVIGVFRYHWARRRYICPPEWLEIGQGVTPEAPKLGPLG